MGIPSLTFTGFLIITALIYYLLPFSFYRKPILICAGLFFYLSFQPNDLLYLGCVILYTYIVSFLLEEKKHPVCLVFAIVPVLAGLCFFKYTNFLFEMIGHSERISLAAPVGISFFTFKSVGYLIDIYQGKCEVERSFWNYAIYVSFFPQILSGPIQKARDFLPQLHQPIRFRYALVRHGFLLIFFGFFEKMLIADRLVQVVSNCFSDLSTLTPSMAMIGTLAYAFQIYSDFDAYSNIAIGMSELFGFECEKNFNAPYLSKNIREFWTRWHISLSSWLKEYVYFPLGGSRKGTLRTYLNVIIVFLVSGLWHGAAMNYVLWGLLNAFVQILGDLMHQSVFSKIQVSFKPVRWMLNLVQIILNFITVTCLWVFFRCSSMEEIKIVFTMLSQFKIHEFVFSVPELALEELMVTLFFVVILLIVDVLRYSGFSLVHFGKLFFPIRWAVYLVMIALMIVFALYGSGYDASKFIYLEF